MRFKKCAAFIFTILILICSGKSALMLYAEENSGYITLIDDVKSPVSFAGIQYSLSEDLKKLSIEFQVMDSHTYKGRQGIRFSLACGGKKEDVFIDSDSFNYSESSFFTLENTLKRIDLFISHSNMKMAFDVYFDKKLSENLILEAEFIDASGTYTEKKSCVLYRAQEPSKNDTESEKSSEGKTESTHNREETSSGKNPVMSTDKTSQYYSYGSNEVNSYGQSELSSSATEVGTSDSALNNSNDFHDNQSSSVGIRQIAAIILAVFLLVAAFAFIILGIKKSKVT